MKKLALTLTIVLVVANIMSGTIFAQADSAKTGNDEAFQQIRDKINAEYGTDIRPATDEKLRQVGITRAEVQKKLSSVSPAQYEADLRELSHTNKRRQYINLSY